MTSLLPGSWIIEVYESFLTTEEPGAKTSYSPSRLFLDLFVLGFFLANLTDKDVSVSGTGRPTSGCVISLDSFSGSAFFLLVSSLLSLSLLISSLVSLLASTSQLSSEISSS